jgi:hypothetical protein
LLWAKVQTPMRSAVMAARACANLKRRLGNDHIEFDHLEEQRKTYEEWAFGVLDVVTSHSEAVMMLTLVPRKQKEDGPELMWANSLMDQACNEDLPCMSFVARQNCQMMLQRYFSGNYAGSHVQLQTDARPGIWLLAQILINFLHLVTFGMFKKLISDIIVVKRRAETNDDDDDDDDEDDDDDDWDSSYFQPGSKLRKSASKDLLPDLTKSLCCFDPSLLWYFWDVPMVKFTGTPQRRPTMRWAMRSTMRWAAG